MTEPYISENISQTDYTLENFNSFERNCLMRSTIKVCLEDWIMVWLLLFRECSLDFLRTLSGFTYCKANFYILIHSICHCISLFFVAREKKKMIFCIRANVNILWSRRFCCLLCTFCRAFISQSSILDLNVQKTKIF